MSIYCKGLLFIVTCALVIIMFIINNELDVLFFQNEKWGWDTTIAFTSATGTVIAAVATWLAAKRAAEGAEIAKKSMEASELAAYKTLQETQLFNRRTSFENRYSILLAQHDQYHKQLCDYIDKEQENFESKKNETKPVIIFFQKVNEADNLKDVFAFLTGHQIISRYMRTLYHLLKYIRYDFHLEHSQNTNFMNEMKKYTSPVRSMIRNDVLLMIAINALNVASESSKNSGYPKYQRLLHEFDFFEHAIFTHPSSPNQIFYSENWSDIINYQIKKTQSKFTDRWAENCNSAVFTLPDVKIFSPLILCLLVYKNPLKDVVQTVVNDFYRNLVNVFIRDELEKLMISFNKAKNNMQNYEQGFFTVTDVENKKVYYKDVIEEIILEIQRSGSYTYQKYPFEYNLSGQIEPRKEWAGAVYSSVKSYIRFEGLHNKILRNGGLEYYLKNLVSDYSLKLEELQDKITKHSVT